MEEITRDGNIVTITTSQTEVFDIDVLKNELEAYLSEPEPTDKELIEAAKTNTPVFYYSPEKQNRIDWLKSKIAELEAL
ncbi:MAG: hypothetical protein BWY21_02013 [Parcubacteria group bacterium ADurb.Bin216]|nr:MAG: hypothetical protein BWY21_02013 [Parcubacteria group bacterium ADurb.Bin216]